METVKAVRQTWEYLVKYMHHDDIKKETMDEYGKAGWELVSVCSDELRAVGFFRVFFKRPA